MMKQKIYIFLGALSLVFTASVMAGPHFGKHFNPLEKMIDHIDLEDDQEEKVEAILERLEKTKPTKKQGMKLFHDMVQLDPDSANYLEQAELKADEAAQELKNKIMSMAQARQEIYQILNEDQKEELQKVLQKKMKRIAKKMNDE